MTTTEPHPPDRSDDRLLPWPQVREIVGLSRTTAWRLQNDGLFPLPVQVSVNRVAWRESEIEVWCAARTPRSSRSPFLHRRPPPTRRPPEAPSPERTQPVVAGKRTPPGPRQDILPMDSGQPPDPIRHPGRFRRRALAEGQIAFDF